ncbi:hypothetical protein [Candidatus Synechococcus spongiarum]|uniref:CpcD-like domain-containing protein n=1 Tax=Candidatus Synechococcus spongiarum TaxID=431041 RepID=A0A164ZRE9_9SYNE|nr:hypothetical protein [Candidatus Synechococcus spongiarum]SAY38930.1 hypothetical protein FLM9_954 [Candidatus Synechococcus spongiarum]
MNVLLAAGPESTTLFTITVQGCSGSPGRFVGQRQVMVPLHRLQSTHRRLLLAGDTILSVTRCQPMGDPPPCPHPDEETELPQQVEHVLTPAHQGQTQDRTTGDRVGEHMIVLLLSVSGVLILLTLQVMGHLAQRWGAHLQARQRSGPPAAVGVWKRDLANLRLGQVLRRTSTS